MSRGARECRWLALALVVTAGVPVPAERAWAGDGRPTVAVAAFDYSDTSGEPRDQGAQHAARLRAFAEGLRADLQASGRYDVVPLPCGEAACAAADTDAATLMARARDAGAALLLFGGVHKMSTLVQFGRVEVVDFAAAGSRTTSSTRFEATRTRRGGARRRSWRRR